MMDFPLIALHLNTSLKDSLLQAGKATMPCIRLEVLIKCKKLLMGKIIHKI